MTTQNKTFSVKNGLDVANTIVLDSNRNLSNLASANLGSNTSITITGGSNGYVLSTNGNGSLSWVAPNSGPQGPQGTTGSQGTTGTQGTRS